MRTIEEVQEWVAKQHDEKPEFSPARSLLAALLAFIDSPPPCEHPKVNAYDDGWFIVNVDDYATYCPDCGEKLEVR